MRRPLAVATAGLLVVSSVAASSPALDLGPARMVHRRGPPPLGHVRRQANNPVTVSGGGAAAGPTSAANAGGNNNGGGQQQGNGGNGNNAGQQTTDNGGNGGLIPGIITSIVDGGATRVTSTAAAPTITQPAPASDPARSTTVVRPTSVVGPTVVQITSTSTFSASSLSASATLAAASASASAAPSSGGLSRGTLIAIIVVASIVALIAGLWTLVRKWKLGPSRRFEDKLQPLDFADNHGHHNGAGFETRFPPTSSASLVRADSNGSSAYGGAGVKRAGSFGSAAGSQRGMPGHQQTMSEVSYSQSQNRGRYGGVDAPIAAGQQPYAPPRGAGNLHNPYNTGAASEYDYDPGLGAAAPGGGYARY